MDRNLLIRTVVAILFGPLIILISYLGGYWLFGMIILFGTIGIGEYLISNKIRLSHPAFWLTLFTVVAMIWFSSLYSYDLGLKIFVGYFLALAIIFVIRKEDPAELFEKQTRLIWGTAYLGLLYPFIFLIRQAFPDNGGDWLLFLFGTIWLADSLAMFGGKAFGKRKLAPTVSPNKTIAGFVSGILGGIIVAVIMYFWLLSDVDFLILLGAGVLVSIIGQLGDLAESCWKRAIGIKDSSKIIPGHGGVLDRFDSLLFSAPALYLYLYYMILK
ncbi:MAG: phosphatidate cytidylyltransferase [Candidatus Zixiibacteriota bacterium]